MATRAPGSGQRRCNPGADALGCASNDCDSACEFAHCVVLPGADALQVTSGVNSCLAHGPSC